MQDIQIFEPAPCLCVASDRVIFGTDKFYAADLKTGAVDGWLSDFAGLYMYMYMCLTL